MMEVRQYAYHTSLGYLMGCPESCNDDARMEMIKEPTEALKAKFQCTNCGEEQYMTYKIYSIFTSLQFVR